MIKPLDCPDTLFYPGSLWISFEYIYAAYNMPFQKNFFGCQNLFNFVKRNVQIKRENADKAQQCKKRSKTDKMVKMVQNGPKWSKMVQIVNNGLKWRATP